jgi:hypothetical protein
MKKLLMAFCLLTGLAAAQSSTVLFEDVKLYYQRAGETKFRDDEGLLALDGSQKVMMVLRENRPLFVMRYDNVSSLVFDEKKDRTLTIQYGGAGPSGSVRMELRGKWKQIVETLQAQAGKPVQMVVKK